MDVLKWRFAGTRADWPESVENDPRPPLGIPQRGEVTVTYIGHATFLIQAEGLNVLTDPVFSERASPFASVGPKRVRKPFIPLESLPKIDVVFVSHNHYDHLDQPSLSWLSRNHAPQFITPLGNPRLIKPCTDGCRVTALDWHESAPLAGGGSLTIIPVQHWSRRGINDINRDLWGGAIIQAGGQKIFFPADTGFDEGLFKDLHKRYGSPDLALLPIGAYEPRWFMNYSHMNPDEAVQTHKILSPKKSMGYHFETFQLTDEAFDAPKKDTLKSLKNHDVPEKNFMIPVPGDRVTLT